MKERPFILVELSKRENDDIHCSKLIVHRGDVIILLTETSARVHLVFGLGSHELLKHEQKRVSRIAKLERVPGQSDS